MEWRDQGSLLSVRPHGENAAIIEVFTEFHGRHAGVVRGGTGRRLAPVLQPGAKLALEWRARLEGHLGAYRVEPLRPRAAMFLGDRLALSGLGAVCALLTLALPEREPHLQLYRTTEDLLDAFLAGGDWLAGYVGWELRLLKEMGYGLDLEFCAVTGAQEGLAYVSPKTGRAVSREAAGEWSDRLLPFPSSGEITASLRTTGYFLEHRLAAALGVGFLPKARSRLLDLIEKQERRGNNASAP